MGWCSATVIFDSVCDALLSEGKKPSLEQTIRELVAALEDGDWDCQQDSDYWTNPTVRKVMKKLHPDWDWKDIEESERE